MSEAREFILAARNAAIDITTEEARAEARRIAEGLVAPSHDRPALHLICESIRQALLALPDLPLGTRAASAAALDRLARTAELIGIVSKNAASFETAAARPPQDEERHVRYRPGVDD